MKKLDDIERMALEALEDDDFELWGSIKNAFFNLRIKNHIKSSNFFIFFKPQFTLYLLSMV